MSVVDRECPITARAYLHGGTATVTLKHEMAWGHIRSHWVRCGDEPDDIAFPSTIKMNDGSGIRISDFW